jgi:phosphate transport system permease protein
VARRGAWLRSVLRADSGGDAVFKMLTGAFALGLVALFLAMLLVLMRGALPSLRQFGVAFLWTRDWNPVSSPQVFGALPFLVGTLASSLIGLVIALPVAIGTAVALALLLPRQVAAPIGLVIELLAAVPSIIFGVWGFAVVVPFVHNLSGGHAPGQSLLAAGFVLAVMVVPIMTAISRDMVLAVPQSQRDAALALGATPWEVTWKVVLPYARPGMLAGVILALGRAIGETIMVIGNQNVIPHSVYDAASTMASTIANQFGEPSGPLHTASLVELGLLLLVFSLVLNLLAKLIVSRLGRRLGVDRL